MVGSDCDPELRLGVGGGASRSKDHHHNQKQITFFYNGQISFCDVTEIQARAIISMAKREMDERKKYCLQDKDQQKQSTIQTPPSGPQLLNPGLSMKRSLQRFLQKRKTRISSDSAPYHQFNKANSYHPCSPCSSASSA